LAIYVVAAKTGILRACAASSLRLAVVTDATAADKIPQPVLLAADLVSTEDSTILGSSVPHGADGAITLAEKKFRQIGPILPPISAISDAFSTMRTLRPESAQPPTTARLPAC
jgi:hypothetical protein